MDKFELSSKARFELMLKDTAQQYEAYEALEQQFGDPSKFLEFCPVQMGRNIRQEAIERFYALNGTIVREHVFRTLQSQKERCSSCHSVVFRRQADDTEDLANTAKAHNRRICEKTSLRPFPVARTTANIKRFMQWLEEWKPPVTSNPVETSGSRKATESAWESLCRILSPKICGQYFRAALYRSSLRNPVVPNAARAHLATD